MNYLSKNIRRRAFVKGLDFLGNTGILILVGTVHFDVRSERGVGAQCFFLGDPMKRSLAVLFIVFALLALLGVPSLGAGPIRDSLRELERAAVVQQQRGKEFYGIQKKSVFRGENILSVLAIGSAGAWDTRTSRRVAFDFPGQAWEANVAMAPLFKRDPVIAYGVQVAVASGIVLITDPLVKDRHRGIRILGWGLRVLPCGVHIGAAVSNNRFHDKLSRQ